MWRLAGRASIFLTFAARSSQRAIICFGKDERKVEGSDVWAMWTAGERPFDEIVSSYRRKSCTMKLPLRKKFLSGAKNYHNLWENVFLKIKPKMRDVLGKMRECGKYVKMRDFLHDCGMVDTYVINTYLVQLARYLFANFHGVLKFALVEKLFNGYCWCLYPNYGMSQIRKPRRPVHFTDNTRYADVCKFVNTNWHIFILQDLTI